MQPLIERDTATAKDIPRPQRGTPAKPIDFYLKRSRSRDIGICHAVVDGQHSMTDIAKALGLSVSRVSRIVRDTRREAHGGAPLCLFRDDVNGGRERVVADGGGTYPASPGIQDIRLAAALRLT